MMAAKGQSRSWPRGGRRDGGAPDCVRRFGGFMAMSRRDGIISGVKAFGVKASSMYSHAREPDTTVMPARRVAAQVSVLTSPVDNGNGVDDYTGHHARGPQGCAGAPGHTTTATTRADTRPPTAAPASMWCGAPSGTRDTTSRPWSMRTSPPDRASYASVAAKPDPNIDFRRTGVLDVFFGKYGITLTNDVNDHAQWRRATSSCSTMSSISA